MEDKPITTRERIRALFLTNATLPSLADMSLNTGIPEGSISGEMALLRKEGWKFDLIGPGMGYVVFPAESSTTEEANRVEKDMQYVTVQSHERRVQPRKKAKRPFNKHSAAYREQWMRKNARLINEIQAMNTTIKYGLITIGLLSASVLAIALHLIISN